jgi:hypothetical protein
LRAAARVVTESFFWGGSAYALRGYGVTLGSSSSHDPFFSRAAAQRREDVDEVAARGVMGTRKLACCDG